MAETATIVLDLDLARVQAELKRIPGMTAREARQMTSALTKEVNKASRASEKAAKASARAQSKAAKDAAAAHRKAGREIERSYNEQFTAFEALSNAAIGGVAGDIVDLGRVATGASGGMAVLGASVAALAIAPAIFGAMASAAMDLADAALEGRDNLREEGIAIEELVSPGALAALEAYEMASADLSSTADILTVQLGSELAPVLTDIANGFIGLAGPSQIAIQSFDKVTAAAAAAIEVGKQAARVGSFGLIDLVLNTAEAEQATLERAAASDRMALATARVESRDAALALQLNKTLAVEQEGRDATVAAYRAREESTAAMKAQTQAAKELEAARKGAHTASQKAAASLHAEAAAERADQVASGEATAAFQAYALEVQAYGEVIGGQLEGTAGDWEVLVANINAGAQALTHFASSIGPVLAGMGQLAGMEARRHAERVRNLQDERSENRRSLQDQVADYEASKADMTAAERQAAQMAIAMAQQSTQATNANIRDIEKEQKRATLAAYKRQKGLQKAQAVIDAARNAVVLTGAMAYLGPFAPAAGAGIAAAGLATQIAVINATPPPKFHTGTTSAGGQNPADIPGQAFGATLERGEAVVSRRGMSTPGAREIIQALEANRAPSFGPQSVRIGDVEADMLTMRQNRPYAPAIRGRAMAGTGTIYRR